MSEKTENKEYIECERCEKNNWDDPEFWGCPRGFCEIEVKGEIVSKTTLTLNKKEDPKDKSNK